MAALVGVPEGTARGWARRFRLVAERIAAALWGFAVAADPAARAPPAGPSVVVAVSAVREAAEALVRLSEEPVDRWRRAVEVTRGGLLAPPAGTAPRATA